MLKQIKKLYVECRCLPPELVSDITDVFNEYEQLRAKDSIGKVNLDQIDIVDKMVDITYQNVSASDNEREQLKAEMLNALVHPKQSQTLSDIRKYIKSCECPSSVRINYRGPKHSYENIKKFVKENILID